ncbi:PapB/FocB family fimbrial expression transcriptional regulator, partial [Escherichia coli]|uniref:PapB/FocB family fimbrial expression transcriptional regulator n=1 Tax=Escherichia coli TaxID=562 RepID=UPI0022713D3D
DGNGSHASTLKSPSYTKSVSWQHYRDFDILIKLSGIHSEKAILALKKYYVDGVIRKIDPTHVMWTRP